MVQQQLVTIAGKIETLEGNGGNTVRAEMERSHTSLKALIENMELSIHEQSSGTRHARKLKGRAQLPGMFSGKKSEFKEWLRAVKAFCNNAFAGFREVLDQAEQQKREITNDDLSTIDWPHVVEANAQLYDLLMAITGGEAQLKVDGTPDENGIEAYRRLCAFYDPYGSQNELEKFNALTTPHR